MALLLLPRRAVIPARRWGPILGLSALYAVLACVWFFRAEGGGFFDLAAVQALFRSPWVALAGCAHYLAFDLSWGPGLRSAPTRGA